MSLILEALKKSEEQRQQQSGEKPQALKRTLALENARRRRSVSLLIVGGVGLTLIVAGLLSGLPRPTAEVAVATETVDAATAVAPRESKPAMGIEPTAVVAVEPAPVPQPLGGTTQKLTPPQTTASAPETADAPLDTSFTAALPLYDDLSAELRGRISHLEMSMHFYSEAPQRRLVRINDRLARENDWLTDDLQLIEITMSGAILDYLGKRFELRR